MTLGVHFAIDATTAGRLLAAADDGQVVALVEEIEEEAVGVGHCDTDKAWDAIHRSLTDGCLGFENGSYPLNAAVLGGVPLHEGDDWIVCLLTPDQVRDVADAVAGVGREALRAGYDQIDVEDYGPEFGDEDFAYTWANFTDLVVFFREAADAGSHVVFTVAQ
ncbi:YfbM family protein [Kitasatospora terrestris]